MEQKLREQKIKITPQRLELIKSLKELGNTHPSFNGIFQATKSTHPHISRSTVYENLKLLVDMGIIKNFHYNGEIRYEMNPTLHVNLAQPNGIIRDLKNQKINKLLKEIERIIKEEEGIEIKNLLILAE